MSAKRILVVDDDGFVGESIKIVLEMEEHTVEVVSDPFDALERYRAGKYDVVLTDNCMPGMTGLELSAKIKELDANQPVLMLTAFPPSKPTTAVDLVLRKPFTGDDLHAAVTKLTEPDK